MRFCDFFISYKIGLKGIKNSIPFTQLPLYRKIAMELYLDQEDEMRTSSYLIMKMLPSLWLPVKT